MRPTSACGTLRSNPSRHGEREQRIRPNYATSAASPPWEQDSAESVDRIFKYATIRRGARAGTTPKERNLASFEAKNCTPASS